jgi:hypothetical protein
MAVLVVLAVVVVGAAAAGLWALDARLDAERMALEHSAAVAGRLRAALDGLRLATSTTAEAHDRMSGHVAPDAAP